jgi:hypothetical protein
MKNGQELKLGDAHVTPRNIQEVQVLKLGDASEAPLLYRQKSGHLSTHYIFIALCTMHFSWSIFTFAFSFFVLFAAINGWTPTNYFWRRFTCFSFAKNTLFFTLTRFAFSFHFFALIFVQILFYLCITSGLWWYSSKELFQKGLNGVGKEKKFHVKKWYKKEHV